MLFTLVLASLFEIFVPSYMFFADWKLAKDKSGIQIYTKNIEEVGFKQIKATVKLESSVESCVALIKDANAGKDWINRVVEFKDLKIENDSLWYTYAEIDIPWPFNNKDLVSKNKLVVDQKSGAVTIFLESMPDFIPEADGKKRIKKSEGSWKFIPQEDGTTEVIYQIFAEPNDFLPQWLVNMVVIGSIFDTFQEFREKVKAY
ncbi:hypothetical protein [Flexithrix dorotheae]|uniref:hypothetical protein n=1 Tax=Flexithrix dorotheae TaxID=70993 RepID=UPI00036FAAA6|nr:hypothetical protein [Flexithrix dorotheae]